MVKAMKKEDLIKLGLDEDVAKKVADASAEELKGFIPKSRFDEVNDEKKTLESTLKERDTQLESLKKIDAEGLQAEIERLQTDNQTKQQEYETQIKQMKIDNAIELALTNSKAKNNKSVKALLDLDKVDLDGDSVKGLEEQIKSLTEAEETKFLFNVEDKQPTFKGARPGEPTDGKPGKEVDVSKMSYDELEQYIEANPDADI
jgi:hypothetical protein